MLVFHVLVRITRIRNPVKNQETKNLDRKLMLQDVRMSTCRDRLGKALLQLVKQELEREDVMKH